MFIFSPVTIVHCISKPWSVDDGERQLDSSFLDQHLGLLHLKHDNMHNV